MKLINRQELVGFLKEIKKENGEITLFFDMQKVIEIPPDFEEKIKKYIGKTISIFFLDNSYFFRVIGGDENAKEKK